MNIHHTTPMNTKLMETCIGHQVRIQQLEAIIARKDEEIARLNAALGNPLPMDMEGTDEAV